MALSLVLLIGANLSIISLVRLQRVDPGFSPDHLLTMQLTMPPLRYSPERVAEFTRQTVNALAAIPGISTAAATTALPLGGAGWGKYFSIEGRPVPASLSEVPNVNLRRITPDYFRAMKATLRRGRFLTDHDRLEGTRVAVVNETLARRFWPDGNPIGTRIALLPPEPLMPPPMRPKYAGSLMTVVGVVADMRTLGLETGPDPEVFAPIAQAAWDMQNSFFVVARTAGEPLGQARWVEAAIRNLDGGLPVVGMQSMEARLNNSFGARRFSLFLLGLFAALALILAVIGLAGVIAYTVSQRTRELGIRAALGAGASDLLRLVVRQGLALAGIGVLVGIAASTSLSGLIASELFEVKPIDPILYAATAALLLILAALACWVPGRRAARTSPAVTLRCD